MKKILLSVLAVLSTCFSFAATYHVDASSGNDTNNGLDPKHAFKSLAPVSRRTFQPGDKILFKCGTQYEGELYINCTGAPGQPITFSSYGSGNKPVINGMGLPDATLTIFNSAYITIENIAITNKGETEKSKRKGIHVVLHNYGIAHNIILRNLHVHDVNGSNVKKLGGGAGIQWTNGGQEKPSAFDSLIIEGCKVERTDRNGIVGSGYWSRTQWFPSKHVIIRNNHLEDIGGDGIVPIGCDSALVEHNTLLRGGQRFPEGDAAAGIWPWSCDNTIIQYNEVAYYGGPWDSQGFDSDWNCRNTLIQYNYSHDNAGGFLLVCNDGSAKAPQSVGNTGTVVRYNVSFNDGFRSSFKAAGFSPVFHFAGPTFDTKVYNNLIIITKARPQNVDSTIVEMGNWNGFSDSTVFANNIFYVEGMMDFNMGRSKRNHYFRNIYYGPQRNIPETDALTAQPAFISPFIKAPAMRDLKMYKLETAAVYGVPMAETNITDFFGNLVKKGTPPVIGIHQQAISKRP